MPLVTNNLYVSGNVSSLNVTGAIKPAGGIVLEDADMKLSQINGGAFLECITLDAGDGIATVVVNEGSSAVVDFRIETDDEDEAIFVDSSTNTIYINKGETDVTSSFHNVDDVVMTIKDNGVVFNEDSSSVIDVRMESNSNTHLFFLDASANGIGINTNSPDELLHIESAISNKPVVKIENTNSDALPPILEFNKSTTGEADNDQLGEIQFYGMDSSNTETLYAHIVVSASDVTNTTEGGLMDLRVRPGTTSVGPTSLLKLGGDSGVNCDVIVNDDQIDNNFRVATAANSHNIYVDSGVTKAGFLDSAAGVTSFGSIGSVQVQRDITNNYAFYVKHHGDNINRRGIRIDCGTTGSSGTNTAMSFRDGDGTEIGNITFTGTTVSYNQFTGGHFGTVEDEDARNYGILLKVDSIEKTNRHIHYNMSMTTSANDRAVIGVYSGELENMDGIISHQVYAVGDGNILVCSAGGNISTGDYICSSNVAGHGMKQSDDLLHNYTVAKALEAVDWSQESETTKLIACTYHAG